MLARLLGIDALGRVLTYALLAGLLIPLAVMLVFSLNSTNSVSWPPAGLSLQWYADALGDRRLMQVIGNSAMLALTVGIAATLLGLAAGFMVGRLNSRFARFVLALTLVPLLAPPLLIALGLVVLLTSAGIRLSYFSVWIGHVTITLPFATLIISSRVANLDRRLEDASADLGAGRVRTFFQVVLPQLFPAIRAAFLFSFVLSFNELVLALFLAGRDQTFPAFMYALFSQVLTPQFYAASSLMVIVAIVLLLFERAAVRSLRKVRS